MGPAGSTGRPTHGRRGENELQNGDQGKAELKNSNQGAKRGQLGREQEVRERDRATKVQVGHLPLYST